MTGSFKFAILRLAPKDVRQEILNVGIVVLNGEKLDIHFSKGLDKVRAISKAVQVNEIVEIAQSLSIMYPSLASRDSTDFTAVIPDLGPLSLDFAGEFVAVNSLVYQTRLASLLKRYIDPEPAVRRAKEKKSRILKDIKRVFQSERVLATRSEGLSSHRIVSSVEIEEGLTADLVLKNGALHVTETVDASSDDVSLRKAISDLGVSCLVLERAKMTFSDTIVKPCLVYVASPAIERSMKPALDAVQHTGAQIINWSVERDRDQYLHGLISLAVPHSEKRRDSKKKPIIGGRLSFH